MTHSGHNAGGEPVLVSACLLGLSTRYDGTHCLREAVVRIAREARVIPVCPEQLGGLPTPRPPAEIAAGDGHGVLQGQAHVINAQGMDVTRQYARGASLVTQIAELLGARRAILKEGSPSCGVTCIQRDGERVRGCGVMTALLLEKGIHIEGVQ